ncbi:hypothetical protein [Mangrovivirga cuniculi]|uniref:Uncharacterized protein n=1 Tax=Mangrovivirga cuniculi TaxID=2715131 RepID=A0A4D7K083_9BACT|nr:hypothetical protein [Mangrovivirga cuniculi]QCK14314.1 hypothetical protein DCC35_05920 [Mangrovivirga cuniculi]
MKNSIETKKSVLKKLIESENDVNTLEKIGNILGDDADSTALKGGHSRRTLTQSGRLLSLRETDDYLSRRHGL